MDIKYLILLAVVLGALALALNWAKFVAALSRFAISALGIPIHELQQQVEGLQGMLQSKRDGMPDFLRFSVLMAHLPVGVIVADVPKRGGSQIVYANERAAALLGYEPQELIGLSIKALVPEDRKEAQDDAFRRACATKDYMRRPWPEMALRKDGSRVIIEHSVAHYEDEQGIHFIATVVAARK